MREFCDLLVNNTKLNSAPCLCPMPKSFQPKSRFARTISRKGNGSCLEAVPSSEKRVFNPSELCSNECGKFSTKISSCFKHGGGPISLHDFVVSGWSECLHEAGLHHRKGPRDRYTNNDCRRDSVVFHTDEGSNSDLEVVFTHAWSSVVLSKLAEVDGFASLVREERQRKKYAKFALSSGGTTSPTLNPLVFEHFGRWGQKAERYLNTLASRASDCYWKRSHSKFVCHWRKLIAVIVQKANAGVILGKIEEGSRRSGR